MRITEITEGGELRDEAPAFVRNDTPHLDNYELRDGDVLIARSGATAGESYVHKAFGDRAVFAGYLIRFQPDTARVLPRFVGLFLTTPEYWHKLTARKRAVAQPNVNAKELASLVLPLPPLAEQERIIKLLDEAEELQKLRTQADRHAAALIPSVFDEMFGDSLKKHNQADNLPLGDVVTLAGGTAPSKEKPEFWRGQIPWVSPKDMKAEEITDAEDHVGDSAFQKTNLQLVPKETVLIVVRGMILAHTVPIRRCQVPVAINQDMKALLPKQPIDPIFCVGRFKRGMRNC